MNEASAVVTWYVMLEKAAAVGSEEASLEIGCQGVKFLMVEDGPTTQDY